MATATETISVATRAYMQTPSFEVETTVLLKPRPLARYAGSFVLLPLLPKRPPLKPLPAEIWGTVIRMAIEETNVNEYRAAGRTSLWNVHDQERARKGKEKAHGTFKWGLALVCKELKAIALPILYESCILSSFEALEKFTTLLRVSDQKWDSIRRIPYSTPGRWVRALDISALGPLSRSEICAADACLTFVFPLVPYLTRLTLSLELPLSVRAIGALGIRDGACNLKSLKGLKYDTGDGLSIGDSGDAVTELIACCTGLEELEVIGLGMDELDMMIAANATAGEHAPLSQTMPLHERTYRTLRLPNLRTLTLLSTPSSDFLLALTQSSLPSLRNAVLTPYGDIPAPLSLVSVFLAKHGPSLRTLVLHTPCAWPTILYPPPTSLLKFCPNLIALSLEGARLELSPPDSSRLQRTHLPEKGTVTQGHPLRSLWIPRPTPAMRELLLQLLPYLPHLREVCARDVRWAKKGMSARALEAGHQGEMRAWRRVLGPRGIRILDKDGKDGS